MCYASACLSFFLGESPNYFSQFIRQIARALQVQRVFQVVGRKRNRHREIHTGVNVKVGVGVAKGAIDDSDNHKEARLNYNKSENVSVVLRKGVGLQSF